VTILRTTMKVKERGNLNITYRPNDKMLDKNLLVKDKSFTGNNSTVRDEMKHRRFNLRNKTYSSRNFSAKTD